MLLAPNVPYYVVFGQAGVSGEGDVDSVVLSIQGTAISQGTAERMTKEFTTLAPSTIKIRQVHNFRTDWTSLKFDL